MIALLALIEGETTNLPDDPATVAAQDLIINALAEVQAGTNILTSTEDNIIIDLLTQGAYTERRSTISNDNGVVDGDAPPAYSTAVTYKGKFYPRGCRGKLERIQIYCKDAGADKITLRYSPHPTLGPIGEVTITPLATWAWRSASIKKMWNYDSLFIWVYKCEAGVDWGYDAVEPYDGHTSGDTGETWEGVALRPFIRAIYAGQTLGDVPVSGTINNIQIPNVSTGYEWDFGLVEEDVEEVLVDLHGAGYVNTIEFFVSLHANSEETALRIYCDGDRVFSATPKIWSDSGYTASTPTFSLCQYAENGKCVMLLTKKFEFRRRLKITSLNTVDDSIVLLATYPTLLR